MALILGNNKKNKLPGTNGNDTILGLGGNDTLLGKNGNDVLKGGAGNDILDGGNGKDKLFGDAGNDVLKGGAGGDVINGGAGFDFASYAGSLSAVLVDLDPNGGTAVTNGDATGDTLISIEGLIGGAFNDTLFLDGSSIVAGTIFGNGGNDDLHGTQGNDTLFGGDGNDFLLSFGGIDGLDGGAGDDLLDGSFGVDFMTGGTGADRFVFFAGTTGIGPLSDVIEDFQPGVDKIDLSPIDASPSVAGDQAFLFDGLRAEGANLSGGVSFYHEFGNTIIQADFFNDATDATDLEIELTGIFNLSASDFTL